MTNLKVVFRIALVLIFILGAFVFLVFNYSWLFAKTVKGEVMEIEVTPSNNGDPASYIVLLKDTHGFMFTAGADDRQWQVVRKGNCVVATLYRYPPWDIERGGGFFNARLRQIYECPHSSKVVEPEVMELEALPEEAIIEAPEELLSQ